MIIVIEKSLILNRVSTGLVQREAKPVDYADCDWFRYRFIYPTLIHFMGFKCNRRVIHRV
jgi:hypothetical protein